MRLHFVVEGQTEETFVRDVLAPEFGTKHIFCDVHRVTTGRRHGKLHRGGMVSFQHLRNDLDLWMKQDARPDSWFTTMVNLYRLPSDFPGFAESHSIPDPIKKVQFLEAQLSSNLLHQHFVPYIQLHEFEALLFSDTRAFSIAFPSAATELADLQAIRRLFDTPEHINEGDDTSPSKRICKLLAQYDKPLYGPLIAKHVGLTILRAECHHFDEWLMKLEAAP